MLEWCISASLLLAQAPSTRQTFWLLHDAWQKYQVAMCHPCFLYLKYIVFHWQSTFRKDKVKVSSFNSFQLPKNPAITHPPKKCIYFKKKKYMIHSNKTTNHNTTTTSPTPPKKKPKNKQKPSEWWKVWEVAPFTHLPKVVVWNVQRRSHKPHETLQLRQPADGAVSVERS